MRASNERRQSVGVCGIRPASVFYASAGTGHLGLGMLQIVEYFHDNLPH